MGRCWESLEDGIDFERDRTVTAMGMGMGMGTEMRTTTIITIITTAPIKARSTSSTDEYSRLDLE